MMNIIVVDIFLTSDNFETNILLVDGSLLLSVLLAYYNVGKKNNIANYDILLDLARLSKINFYSKR